MNIILPTIIVSVGFIIIWLLYLLSARQK